MFQPIGATARIDFAQEKTLLVQGRKLRNIGVEQEKF